MRGEKVLSIKKDIKKKSAKGRSSELIDKRNKLMVLMFIFYQANSDLKYEAILERLKAVFFISEIRIAEVLIQSRDILKQNRHSITTSELEKEYPQIKWKTVL